MEFNSTKFEVIQYGNHESMKSSSNYKSPNGSSIPTKSSLKDLGVMLSDTGSFDVQIQSVIKKVSSMLGWIYRTFKTRHPQPMLTLYKSLVRSPLEYACPLWSPTKASQIAALEAVQRSFTRKIVTLCGADRPDYWSRLQILGLQSLQRRRERYLVLYIFKIINELVPNPGIIWSTNPRTGIHAQVQEIKAHASAQVRQLRSSSLSYHGAKTFNCLPIPLCSFMCDNERSPTLEAYKRKLDKFLSTVPDQPTVPGLLRAADSNQLIDQVTRCH